MFISSKHTSIAGLRSVDLCKGDQKVLSAMHDGIVSLQNSLKKLNVQKESPNYERAQETAQLLDSVETQRGVSPTLKSYFTSLSTPIATRLLRGVQRSAGNRPRN